MFSLVLLAILTLDFEAVKAEPVLEKRAKLAIDLAEERLTDARQSYEAGNDAAFKKQIVEAADASEYALVSLEETGKHPSQNVKHYKPAEKRVRGLLRRLTTLRHDTSFEMRAAVADCERRVNTVHEKLLEGVMSRKPKS